MTNDNPLIIAGKTYESRLLVGTGKYKDVAETKAAIIASGAEIITVAVRRLNAEQQQQMMDELPPESYSYLPNTAGCYDSESALRTLRLAREASGKTLVKLEVLGDEKMLYPNIVETLKSAKILVDEGFDVMAYTSDDLLVAKELEKIGCVAVMPLGAPIGSGLGIQNKLNIRLIAEALTVPVLVDAGVGTASDATLAMELGCDGVLMNTALAEAHNPVQMATAMKHAVIAGRQAYLAGRMPMREYGVASSPKADKLAS